MRYFTFKKVALAHKAAWQKLRFTAHRGYWLFGRRPAPKPGVEFLMYDSVTPDQMPGNAQAVAGYVGGNWPTFSRLAEMFPHAAHVSIAVNAGEDAMVLDVEPGDATNAQAPDWYKRQLDRGEKRPKLYTSVSNVEPLLAVMEAAGFVVPYEDVWSAHYTLKPHRCGPACGFGLKATVGATQFHNRYLGRNLDASLCSPTFLA